MSFVILSRTRSVRVEGTLLFRCGVFDNALAEVGVVDGEREEIVCATARYVGGNAIAAVGIAPACETTDARIVVDERFGRIAVGQILRCSNEVSATNVFKICANDVNRRRRRRHNRCYRRRCAR